MKVLSYFRCLTYHSFRKQILSLVLAVKLKKILANTLVSDSLRIMVGTMISQVVMLVALFFLTKLYSPDAFGVLGSFQSILSMIWIFATFKYDLAISVATDRVEKASLTASVLMIAVAMSCLLAILVWLGFDAFIAQFQSFKHLSEFKYLIPLTAFVLACFSIFEYYVISNQNFKYIAYSKIIQAVVMSATQLGLSQVAPTGISLVLGYLFGYLASSIFLSSHFWSHGLSALDLGAGWLERSKGVLAKYVKFPILSLPSSFANLASTNIPILMIGAIYSPELAGHFFLAQRVIGMPIDILTNSVSQVFLGNSAQMMLQNPEKVTPLFHKMIRVMLALGIIPFLLLFWQSEHIVTFIFGPTWLMTGSLISIFTVMYFSRMVTMPLSQMLNVLQRLDIQLYWDLLRLFLLILLFTACYRFQLPLITFAMLFSGLMAFMYALHAFLGYYFLKQKTV
jgi:O-antigen/teichoic acid export membrane protein